MKERWNLNIRLMNAISFLSNIHLFGAVSIPFFRELAHLNYAQTFLIQTWFTLAWFLLEIPTGVVAEKFGRRESMMLGYLAVSIGSVLTGLFPSFVMLMLSHTVLALGGALISGADKALFYDSLEGAGILEKGRVSALNTYSAYGMAGKVLGFVSGGFVSSINYPLSLGWTFIANAFFYFLCSILSLRLYDDHTPVAENPIILGIRGLSDLGKVPINTIDSSLISSLLFMVYWLYQPVLLGKGLPISYIGFVPVAMNMLSAAILHFSRPGDIAKWIFASSFISALFILAMPFSSLPLATAFSVFAAAIQSLRKPLLVDELNRKIRKRRAVVNSAVSMLYNISRALVYSIAGWMLDASFSGTFAAISFAVIALSLALFIARKSGKAV